LRHFFGAKKHRIFEGQKMSTLNSAQTNFLMSDPNSAQTNFFGVEKIGLKKFLSRVEILNPNDQKNSKWA